MSGVSKKIQLLIKDTQRYLDCNLQMIYSWKEYKDCVEFDWDGQPIIMSYKELDRFIGFYKKQEKNYDVQVRGGITHYGRTVNRKEVVITDQYLIEKGKFIE